MGVTIQSCNVNGCVLGVREQLHALCRYAAGATIQILLFGILAIEVKRKAPTAHTVLEIISESPPTCHPLRCLIWHVLGLAQGSHCILMHTETAILILHAVLEKFTTYGSYHAEKCKSAVGGSKVSGALPDELLPV